MEQSFELNEEHAHENQYFLFSLGSDSYAVPLLSIREVAEIAEIRQLPQTIDACAGIMNLRGSIVIVIDIAKRFAIPHAKTATKVLFVIECHEQLIATIVDQVLSVVEIPKESIDHKTLISGPIQAEFILGVARLSDKVIPLIGLKKVLEKEDLLDLTARKKLLDKAS